MPENKNIMGAVIGDIIGSVFEWNNVKTIDFPLFSSESDFTDDSVLTIATMDCILNNLSFQKTYQEYGKYFSDRGFGGSFIDWIFREDPQPYNSWGNGSAMRVSPVGWAYNTLEEVLKEAKKSSEVSHNHPEGIKGAQATAAAVFLARSGHSKDEIRQLTETMFGYDLSRTTDEIRSGYKFNESCQGTVPETITSFLESRDYEHAVRLAISLGGDSDTLGCITGGIAEAFYGEIPDHIIEHAMKVLSPELTQVLADFSTKFRKTYMRQVYHT